MGNPHDVTRILLARRLQRRAEQVALATGRPAVVVVKPWAPGWVRVTVRPA